MTDPETPEPGTFTVDHATGDITFDKLALIRAARGLAVLAVVGAAVYFSIPRPPDPGVTACARVKVHVDAGTHPDAAERERIAAAFSRSDQEVLVREADNERLRTNPIWGMIAGGGRPSIGPDGAPVIDPAALPQPDLTDFRSFYTACADVGAF